MGIETRKTLFYQCFLRFFKYPERGVCPASENDKRRKKKEERRKKKEERRKKKEGFFLLSSFFFLLSSFGMGPAAGPRAGHVGTWWVSIGFIRFWQEKKK